MTYKARFALYVHHMPVTEWSLRCVLQLICGAQGYTV